MRKRIWLRWVTILVVVLVAASAGFSHLLKGNTARRYLIAHLQASFGRPVDVRRFDFSLLDGAELEAESVTVAEDPQFGNDYFLRAESLTAGLRWSALLAGRVEFGSVSLTRPSLNLVRDSQGRWNIDRWLPPSPGATVASAAPRPPAKTPSPERLDKIYIDGGRINFKKGEDKAEFALLDVSGNAEQESPGRWGLDLEATPMRVGVELQEIGTLRLRGTIGGTAARLQPAQLNIDWRGVSLADALRLADHFDYGVRGTMDLNVTASVAPVSAQSLVPAAESGAQWNVSAVARLQDIHGWRLPPRDSDPAANLTVEAAWRLGDPQATVSKLLLEMANSHVQGSGDVEWSHGFNPNLHIASSTIGLADVAAFFGALRPGVAQDLRAQGILNLDATLSSWPLQLRQADLTSAGGVLTASTLPSALRIGPINVAMSRGALNLAPSEVSFVPAPAKRGGTQAAAVPPGPAVNSFMFRGSLLPDAFGVNSWPSLWTLSIDGGTPRLQDWALLAQVLGQPFAPDWSASGGVTVSVRGTHTGNVDGPVWSGTVDTHDAVATLPFLNQPLRLPATHVEFSPSQLTLAVGSAQALGAAWRGTISRKTPGGAWSFDLTADELDVADLDRWLGPRARSGLFAALGFSGSSASNPESQARDTAIAGLVARGRVRVGEIALAPLRLETFDGDVEIAGRSIVVHKAQAGFFGGKVNGLFEARLTPDPSYRFHGQFDRVDLTRLSRAVQSLGSRFSGTASAALNLTAHGIGRANLIRSLEGEGQLDARNAEMQGVSFSSPAQAGNLSAPPFLFASAKGSFRIQNGAVDSVNFVLADSSRRFQAEGRIDFSQLLTLKIRPLTASAKLPAGLSSQGFVLAGTVEQPRLTPSEDSQSAPEGNTASSVRR